MSSESYKSTRLREEEGPGVAGYAAVALAWAVPGLGHFLLGEKGRALTFAAAIHGLFAFGMLIGGIRAINPPEQQIWTYTQFLTGWPMVVANKIEKGKTPEVKDLQEKYAAGKPVWDGERNRVRPPVDSDAEMADREDLAKKFIQLHPLFSYHPKVQDIGAVYCGIAGMLNLLVVFDVLLRVTGSQREVPGKKAVTGGGAA